MASDRKATRDARVHSMVNRYFETVWRALRRLGVPEAAADDAAQQVFLVASRRIDEIEEGGERAYLLGIGLRVASDMRRAASRRRGLLDVLVVESSTARPLAPAPDEMVDHKRLRVLLVSCLDEMPDKLREAFVLFEIEELGAPEVAKLLDVPVGTVASRVRRAREHIRKNLAKRGAP
jgi:RNA polymerase sigma-70 factor (ECF subfamily)